MRIYVRKKQYKLEFTSVLAKNVDGLCDPPCGKNRKIRVNNSLTGERRLEVIIHELLHAAYWDMDESAVEEVAEDIARVLWRLNYRPQH